MADNNTGNAIVSWLTNHANVLNNIANNVAPLEKLVTGVAYLMGLMFAFKAIHSLKALGESRSMMSNQGNIKEPAIYLVVASVLLYFPTALQVFLNSSFNSPNIMSWKSINSSNSIINALFGSSSIIGRPLALIIQLIGVIAFVRGWVLIARSVHQGQQPGGTGKGITHVFGGILAMNIVATLQIINNTLYGNQ